MGMGTSEHGCVSTVQMSMGVGAGEHMYMYICAELIDGMHVCEAYWGHIGG